MMIYFINMLYIYIFLLDTEKVVRAHHIIKKFWSRKNMLASIDLLPCTHHTQWHGLELGIIYFKSIIQIYKSLHLFIPYGNALILYQYSIYLWLFVRHRKTCTRPSHHFDIWRKIVNFYCFWIIHTIHMDMKWGLFK